MNGRVAYLVSQSLRRERLTLIMSVVSSNVNLMSMPQGCFVLPDFETPETVEIRWVLWCGRSPMRVSGKLDARPLILCTHMYQIVPIHTTLLMNLYIDVSTTLLPVLSLTRLAQDHYYCPLFTIETTINYRTPCSTDTDRWREELGSLARIPIWVFLRGSSQ
jgi:hypothetical protein